MANILAVLVALFVFFLMFLLKIPMKRWSWRIAEDRHRGNEGRAYALYRRLNVSVIIMTVLLSVLIYYLICLWGGLHHKLCCSFKAGVLALALYALYDQWFSPGRMPREEGREEKESEEEDAAEEIAETEPEKQKG